MFEQQVKTAKEFYEKNKDTIMSAVAFGGLIGLCALTGYAGYFGGRMMQLDIDKKEYHKDISTAVSELAHAHFDTIHKTLEKYVQPENMEVAELLAERMFIDCMNETDSKIYTRTNVYLKA